MPVRSLGWSVLRWPNVEPAPGGRIPLPLWAPMLPLPSVGEGRGEGDNEAPESPAD